MIELSVFEAECQLQQLLLRLRSAETAKQALAKLICGAHERALRYSDRNPPGQDEHLTLEGVLVLYVAARVATRRRQIESVLRESEANFQAMAETATSAIFIYQDERLCYVNPATEQMTGYTQAELCTMNLWDLVDPDLLTHANRLENQLGKPVFFHHELEVVTKSGESRCLEVTATWAEFKGRPALIGTALD
ncbi:MAG: PAS domain S-box protein [Leptolyngbyaceae cyanobacterium SM1_4_3]|nr:PAS domain S-box protein [Leptolyngbyaceae cyanobacterium SM1_4_3]NJN89991.1 PAS domain S-box protein [Leptolyngbyaceae cyanobacterium SL_5_14]